MARVLIVGCGCRGRSLAAALVAAGHAVRGISRDPGNVAAIEAAGAEGVVGDPDRLGTLLPHLEQVSALCWLMGTAGGDPEKAAALHVPRLRSLVDALVDTHVRGFLYEAAGSVSPSLLAEGTAIVRAAERTYRMPVEVVTADPQALEPWLSETTAATGRLLAG